MTDFDPAADYDDGDQPSLYDAVSVQDYETALEVAARWRINMDPAAAEDARIYAIGEMGSVQVIGTGKAWPSNAQQVLSGPVILAYAKDVNARASELLGELANGNA